jgi:hypothetical protein
MRHFNLLTCILASVDIKTYYYSAVSLDTSPTSGWLGNNVSAGIGAYEPDAAAAYQDAARIELPYLVESLFRDASFTYPLPAISRDCKAARGNCSSFLLSGGMQSVKPLPFISDNFLPIEAPFYTVESMPSYHIDFWDGPETNVWKAEECHTYGLKDSRFQVCIQKVETLQTTLLAGMFDSQGYQIVI